jgi:flagellar biosynthesis protein FliR
MEIDLYTWMLVFLRVSAFLLALPFFSATNFPVTMRVALAALTALLLAPILPPVALGHLPFFSLFGVMIQEVFVGLLLGFVARLIFYAVDLGGSIIANELGLNMASILDPMSQTNSQVTGTILFYLATVVMLTLNLHHWILAGFVRTYSILPVGAAHLPGQLFDDVSDQVANVFVVALEICAPVLAVSFVISVVFGVLSRAVPQMNVFILSFSFRLIGGLIVFGFTLQLAAQHVVNYLHRLPDDLLTVAQLIGLK